MKKLLCLFMILLFFPLGACNHETRSITVKDGTYILKQSGSEIGPSPSVTISNETISFFYDALSSYWPHGTYTIEDNLLIMTTDDKKYQYVFHLEEDQLLFQKDDSSPVSLIDRRLGVELTDNAVFQWKDN